MGEINVPIDPIGPKTPGIPIGPGDHVVPKQPMGPSKETILASARLIKGIVEGTMYKNDFYKDDDVTPKIPTEKAIFQQLNMLESNINYIKDNQKMVQDIRLDFDERVLMGYIEGDVVMNFLKNGSRNWITKNDIIDDSKNI